MHRPQWHPAMGRVLATTLTLCGYRAPEVWRRSQGSLGRVATGRALTRLPNNGYPVTVNTNVFTWRPISWLDQYPH